MIPTACGRKVLTPSSISRSIYTIVSKPVRTFSFHSKNWTPIVFFFNFYYISFHKKNHKKNRVKRNNLFLYSQRNNAYDLYIVDHERLGFIIVRACSNGAVGKSRCFGSSRKPCWPCHISKETYCTLAQFRNPSDRSSVVYRVTDRRNSFAWRSPRPWRSDFDRRPAVYRRWRCGSLRHRSTECSPDVTQSIEKDKRHGVCSWRNIGPRRERNPCQPCWRR